MSQKASHARMLRTMSGETIIFLVMFVSIALAGFNTGNNLLYLIAGVMLGVIVVSLIAGRINLSRIQVSRRFPTYVFARHPFRINLTVFNHKRYWRSFGINLEERTQQRAPLFFFSIENRGKESREIEVALEHRGLYRFPHITFQSKFPFGLFTLHKSIKDSREIVVYPYISDLSKVLGGSSYIQDEFPRHLKGPGSGLYGIREYRHGEEAANISWKLSAKLDRLMVRQTELEARRRVCIVFDNALQDTSTAALEAFEQCVSNAASLVWYLCGNGYSVKLVTRDKTIGYGEGTEQAHKILIVLALIEALNVDKRELAAGRSMFEGGTGVLVRCVSDKTSPRPNKGDFSLVIGERFGAEGP